jgi:pimeloyl-ACP methyl ester carboxylesterase
VGKVAIQEGQMHPPQNKGEAGPQAAGAVQAIGVVLLALLLVLAVVGCTSGEGGTGVSQEKQKAPKGTFELPNGRILYLKCLGSGSPTIVLEVGQESVPRSPYNMAALQEILAREHMTCRYDRANTGAMSDWAPTPRSAGDIVKDLHQLLETADVPGPYVLTGNSAGGTFVQLYGRRYSDEDAGVVAMNPVPPAHPWLDRALPLVTKVERARELSYYRGEQGFEHIDWLTSGKELKKAPSPPPVPFEMLISTKMQCEGDSFCEKSYNVYEEVLREVVHQWPEGNFHQVQAYHDIYLDKPKIVVDSVKHVASK